MSQKIVTVHTHTNTFGENKFAEHEFPVVTKYLDDGYSVKQIVPVILSSTAAYMYSLTFVLEKLPSAY